MLYATRDDGSKAEIRISYNHRTTPEFSTTVVNADGTRQTYFGHPKRVGVTKKNGWELAPDFKPGGAMTGGW